MTSELFSPALYPLAYDPQAEMVRFLPMIESEYATASFLDNRIGIPLDRAFWTTFAEVQAAAAAMPVKCHYLFHISHVGSTLLARLLGEHTAIFALREPAIFRWLATANRDALFDTRLRTFLALWSRTFSPEQTSLIKATSFVCEMAAELVKGQPAARAIAMYVSPRRFLLALLDGAMSDITSQGPARSARLRRRLPGWTEEFAGLSPGEQVMMSWLTEMLALAEAANAAPQRIFWLDFDRFLKNPFIGLMASLRFLGVNADDTCLNDVLSGPIMSRYAKAPTQAFDASFREQLLLQSEMKHTGEIARGLEWRDRMAKQHRPVAQLLNAGL